MFIKFLSLKTTSEILSGACPPLVLLMILGAVNVFKTNSIVTTSKRVEYTHNVIREAAAQIRSAADEMSQQSETLRTGVDNFLATIRAA